MFEFEWLIHYKCNYRCPYCFFAGYWSDVEKRNAYLPNDKWVCAWKRLGERCKNIQITITGGEPTIYPDFANLLIRLTGFASIAFDTNLSLDFDQLRLINDNVDKKKLFMGLSFHPLFANKADFLKKVEYLRDNGFHIRVHYVTYPEQLGGLKDFQEIITSMGVNFAPLPFRGIYKDKVYPSSFNDTDKAAITNIAGKLETPKEVRWVNDLVTQVKSLGKKCNAGRYYCRVDSDGTAYVCAKAAMKNKDRYVLGNIFEDTFKLNDEPVTCEQETCPCEFRWLVEK
jgi:MoaA/NifB/PqqE/SkfB family radical SAM enzyme